MNLKDRKRRDDRPKITQSLTTISSAGKQKKTKQDPPACYRFSDYDKAEIALGVANVKTKTKVTPAKLLRALVRLNNLGYVNENELAKMIDSM